MCPVILGQGLPGCWKDGGGDEALGAWPRLCACALPIKATLLRLFGVRTRRGLEVGSYFLLRIENVFVSSS